MEHPIVINSKGKIGTIDSLNRIYGNRVVVPQFEIYANPTIRIADVKSRRFNLIGRDRYQPNEVIITSEGKIGLSSKLRHNTLFNNVVQKARQEIMEQEDAAIFAALDQADKEKE